jgi:hypothetical protein
VPTLPLPEVSRGTTDATLVLHNGLVRRTFRLTPNAATIGLDHLVTGESLLRAVEPEAVLTLNGETIPVGGLAGQPDRGYLTPAWASNLTNLPRLLPVHRLHHRPTHRTVPLESGPPRRQPPLATPRRLPHFVLSGHLRRHP